MVHTFEYNNEYFALDVETGSVLVVDKSAYDAIGRLRGERDIDAALLSSDDPIYAQIRELKEEGLLFSKEAEEEPKAKSVVKAINMPCHTFLFYLNSYEIQPLFCDDLANNTRPIPIPINNKGITTPSTVP